MKKVIALAAAAAALVAPTVALAHGSRDLSKPPTPVELKGYLDEHGKQRFTHGPDKAPRIPESWRNARSNKTQQPGVLHPIVNTYYGLTDNSGPYCGTYWGGVSVPRYVVVKVMASGVADSSASDSAILWSVGAASQKMHQDHYQRPVLDCNNQAAGPVWSNVTILKVTEPTCGANWQQGCPFSTIANRVRSTFGVNGDVRYLVFYEGAYSGYCGQSDVYGDSRPDPAVNLNNTASSTVSVVYRNGPYNPGVVDCWYTGATLHELLHSLGAVQNDSPHTTGGYHCYDGSDVMCYNDGGPQGSLYSPDYYCRDYVYIDCNPLAYYTGLKWQGDDYWNNDPSNDGAGGTWPPYAYIRQHWNLDNSKWVTWK